MNFVLRLSMGLKFGFVNRFEVEFRFWDLWLDCVCDLCLRFVVTTLITTSYSVHLNEKYEVTVTARATTSFIF
jgi:hypothetical protein